MTSIRKQWLKVLFFTAIISVIVNTLLLSLLMNRYFVDYSKNKYDNNLNEIVTYSKIAMKDNSFSQSQINVQLESYLDDPITRIRLYNSDGMLVAEVGNEYDMNAVMMNSGMMNRVKNRMMNHMKGIAFDEVDSFELTENGIVLGKINITRNGSIENSIGSIMYNAALLSNSFFSIIAVFILVLIIGIIVSRRMSNDLRNTASMALNIEMGNEANTELSNINEIRTIQSSLLTLNSKLKLKQKSRKKLIDEMVHQTRTPLTILKTHLEGLEDGVIDMTPEAIKACENQVDNVTLIISNMSSMIDAEKDTDSVQYEEFEINQLLKQIVGGLKLQFDKKHIELNILSDKKIIVNSDKYKLSQSIYNLLTNAYKFTESDGKVVVNYDIDGSELFISIEDNGIGISEEDKTHIFDAYYRGKNTAGSSGEGIGLYVVKENLDKINGTIDVISKVGEGSKFTIMIPLKITT